MGRWICERTQTSHTYSDNFSEDEVTIKIVGKIEGWGAGSFGGTHSSYRQNLVKVINFGDLGWKTLSYAFSRCSGLNEFFMQSIRTPQT